MVDAGADVIEVGVPYSDPLMDGPVIQAAVDAALRSGARVADVFPAVRAVVEAGAAAVVMPYWNLVERYGVAAFARDLAEAGGSGLVTPDLIPEEAGTWLATAAEHGLDPIFLVAPSSTDARLALTSAHCRGFVYAASTMGVTGARSTVQSSAAGLVARLRSRSEIPVCVGLGVSTGEQAREIAHYADGVIVGSALVRALGTGGVAAVAELTAELAAGVRAPRA
ncbi:MAG: tryptophan synthase subunit alpha, partial [Angustibacter sp.]